MVTDERGPREQIGCSKPHLTWFLFICIFSNLPQNLCRKTRTHTHAHTPIHSHFPPPCIRIVSIPPLHLKEQVSSTLI